MNNTIYKVETKVSFPHDFDIYEVVKGTVWYASFALKEDADDYAKRKNMFIGLDEQIEKQCPRNVDKQK